MSGRPFPAADISIAALLADASWFPEGLDLRDGMVSFVRSDRATLAAQPFLDDRWERVAAPRRRVAARDLAAGMRAEPAELSFIWHTAFCASTAVAGALDHAGSNLSLREPEILVGLSELKRQKLLAPQFAQAVFRLLARRHSPSENILLKPSNSANCLLPEAIRLTDGRMLVLYSDCRSFLISVAKRSEKGRAFVRRLFNQIAADNYDLSNWPIAKLFEHSDLEIAALVWHMQIAQFLRSWSLIQPGRIASLDCDAFFASPERTLAALDGFFGLGLGAAHGARLIEDGLLARDSKQRPGRDFDLAQRQEENDAIARQIGPVLDEIVAWSYRTSPATPRGTPLGNPLVPLDKAYCP